MPIQPAPEEEIESFQQMLEPDRTGVRDTRDSRVLIALVVVLVLLGALGAGIFLYKDQIFG